MSNEQFGYQRLCTHALTYVQRLALALCIGALVSAVGGCAGYNDWRDGNTLLKEGRVGEGLAGCGNTLH